MKRKLGLLTIGQSPRTDLVPDVRRFLDPDVEIVEAGALDGLTLKEVSGLCPEPGDFVLVTRMADGTQVRVAARHILPRVRNCFERLLAQGSEVVAIACTAEFPPFRCNRPVVKPHNLLFSIASEIAAGMRLGVLVPDEAQVAAGMRHWSGIGSSLRVDCATPYGAASAIERAAGHLRDWGAEIVVMDCIGYTVAMKDLVTRTTRAPVILARSVFARILGELL